MHELNKTLVDLVEFLASDFQAYSCKLNPTAKAHAPSESRALNDVSEILTDAECVSSASNATKDTSIDNIEELKRVMMKTKNEKKCKVTNKICAITKVIKK